MSRRMTFGLMVAAWVAAVAVACGGATITELSGPDAVRCQTTVSALPAIPAAGSRLTATVGAERECTWTAASEASWVQVSPASGQGEASLTIVVAANPDTRARSATIVVNELRLSLSQQAAPCRFDLSKSAERMSHAGGRATVAVSTTAECEWRASSDSSWAGVLSDSGTGAATVAIEVSRNEGAERTATLTIAGHTFTITQDAIGRPGPAPTPPPAPGPTPPGPPSPPAPPGAPACAFTIDDDSRSFGADAGEGSVRVFTLDACAWSASANAGWISITSGGSGKGSGTVRYVVAANGSSNDRTGTIAVAWRTHTVRQAGVVPPEPERVRKIKLEGRVSNMSGSCPGLSFTVEDRSVFTSGDTKFKGGCGRIRNGVEVEVEGDLLSDGRVRAREVEIDD